MRESSSCVRITAQICDWLGFITLCIFAAISGIDVVSWASEKLAIEHSSIMEGSKR